MHAVVVAHRTCATVHLYFNEMVRLTGDADGRKDTHDSQLLWRTIAGRTNGYSDTWIGYFPSTTISTIPIAMGTFRSRAGTLSQAFDVTIDAATFEGCTQGQGIRATIIEHGVDRFSERAVLERELKVVEELLEIEPDSACMLLRRERSSPPPHS